MNEEDLKLALRRILALHVGRANAIKAERLAEMFGYRDDRAVRLAIEEMIKKDNFPICSDTNCRRGPLGYFFPASVDEARIYSKALQKRAVHIFLRRRHIIRSTARYYERARQEAML